jgi:indole-3-glycerol phosphate synthase
MKHTQTILDQIIEAKKTRLIKSKEIKSQHQLEDEIKHLTKATNQAQGFYATLKAKTSYVKIIGEIKIASPSSGNLNSTFSLEFANEVYQNAEWISAISIITEEDYFGGSVDNLRYVEQHNLHQKPLLRKDFIFDTYQIVESKLLGADAYLLIASLFDSSELDQLVECGLSYGLEPLIEVHSIQELEVALKTKARCIGVNSRNLHSFSINNELHNLLASVDDSYVRIAESGVETPEYLAELGRYADAALIGSYFMKSDELESAVNSLKIRKQET